MKKAISIIAFTFSLLTFFASLVFFLEYVLRDPQYVLETIFDKGFYWRLVILIVSFVSCLFNMLSLVLKQDQLFKTTEERKQERKAKRDEKILQLNAKIEKLKNEGDD